MASSDQFKTDYLLRVDCNRECIKRGGRVPAGAPRRSYIWNSLNLAKRKPLPARCTIGSNGSAGSGSADSSSADRRKAPREWEGEFGMSLEILRKNEDRVVENLRKRGMEKNLHDVKVLKILIEEKNKLEIATNNLRNRRKLLSEEVKNLLFADEKKEKNLLENLQMEKTDKCKMSSDIPEDSGNYDGIPIQQLGEGKQKVKDEKNSYLSLENKIEMIKKKISNINDNININEGKMFHIKSKIEEYLNKLPNILLHIVPEGKTVNDNKIIKMYRVKTINNHMENIFFESHENILKVYNNNPIFSNISNKIGFGYNILVKNIAKLERALIDFMIYTHVDKFMYTYVKTPVIVAKSALIGTGQLPKFENDLFKINDNYKILNEDAYLIPTSEVSLLNLFKNSLIDYKNLPIKLVSHSSCFRNEKNVTYGKTSKGLLREHIFEKVELISITDRKTSSYYYTYLIKHCEYILKKLKIPYRLVLLNSLDTPFSSSICYDIEAWLPSQKRFIEVSSCSNCLDFQARKLNLKYKKKDKNIFCHTINGSGLAVGRILAIILEQYQICRYSKDEQVQLMVPKPLRKYMNASVIDL
ncbi:serine--tRNA ligase, putative [Plasmodium ovale wallikeri]|uniref:serine--tRNA ligase n=1 Tax=Plasmodium ovale wallikeri TaxID=864142 RepID=A0A1A8ZXU7_PLAOA|nr:serine--tRNA ligase, putative [Plasmodium ovale wallikeri]SBT48969.1 serine--tRNA ligase, putative [Plasmodium ovale wallikeri]